jgi:hypothetical protein
VTLQESIRRAILYSTLTFVLTTVVVVGDATLARTDSQVTPTPTATPAPVVLPADFKAGPYSDQFGETVQIDPVNVTSYSRDNHGNEWIGLGNRLYYRTASGTLYRTEAVQP